MNNNNRNLEFRSKLADWAIQSLLNWKVSSYISNFIRANISEAVKRMVEAKENRLEVLDLSNLDLQDLPEFIGEITSLRELNIRNNEFKNLSEVLSKIPNFIEVIVDEQKHSLHSARNGASDLSEHFFETDEEGRTWHSFSQEANKAQRTVVAEPINQTSQQSLKQTSQMHLSEVPKLDLENLEQSHKMAANFIARKQRPSSSTGIRNPKITPSPSVWRDPNSLSIPPHEEVLTRTHVARTTPRGGKAGKPIGRPHGDVPAQSLVDNSSKSSSR